MKSSIIVSVAFAALAFAVRADEPTPARRPISAADSVLAVYVESLGFGGGGQDRLLLAVWPDGVAVWSKDRLKGGAPYLTGKVEPKRVAELLKRVEADGLFADKKTRWSNFGPDSTFTTIFLKSGKDTLKMQSWHELGEAGGHWAGTDGGLTMLDGRRRLDVIRQSSTEFLYFRFVWAETRGRLNDLLPVESRPTSGRPVMKAGEYYWEDEPAKDGAEAKPAEHVEITIKLFVNLPKEIGPKSHVDVRTISATLLKPAFPEVLLSNVEVVSLDRTAETATIQIEKKDEDLVRKAEKGCSLYLSPRVPAKDGKPKQ
jgi:hypothetical protein